MTGVFTIAIHALVYLDHNHSIMSSELIAKNVCTNPSRIRKVLAKLKKNGLVKTKEGIDGGYYFDQDSKTLSLKEIALAVEADFVTPSWKSGDKDMDCPIASKITGVMSDVYTSLNYDCLERLNKIYLSDIENKIFHK